MAPHGGWIEPSTSELAEAVAGGEFSFYTFRGIRESGSQALHLTSHRFDEPVALEAASNAEVVVAFHGERTLHRSFVMLGGCHLPLLGSLAQALSMEGFDVREPRPGLAGTNPRNICNRGASGAGVQLELSEGLRKALRGDSDLRLRFISTVRRVLLREETSVADSKKLENRGTAPENLRGTRSGRLRQLCCRESPISVRMVSNPPWVAGPGGIKPATRTRTEGSMNRDTPWVTEGLITGFVWYGTVVLLFALLNLSSGEGIFHTPSVLGSALFFSGEGGTTVTGAAPGIAYNGVHILISLVIGLGAAWLVFQTERHHPLWFVVFFIFLAGFIFSVVIVGVMAAELSDLISWPVIVLANLLAGVTAGGYLWRRHRRLWAELGEASTRE